MLEGRKVPTWLMVLMLTILMVVPVSGLSIYNQVEREVTGRLNNGKILYVGGIGPGNHTSIQDAIDNASDGDTVFVYDDSSPYYENVIINKSIDLIGEDRNTTIVDGNQNVSAILTSTDGVTICGFTIQNSGYFGIEVKSNYTKILGNVIKNNNEGVSIYRRHDNIF